MIMSRNLLILLLLSYAPLSACTSNQEAPHASPNAKRYDLRGTVVSVDRSHKQVIIAHESIPGLMDAMTMPFTLYSDWAFDTLAPGDQIQATLVVDGDRSWLENPVIVRGEAAAQPPPSSTEAPPGTEVPPFTFINQDGARVRLVQYRGRALVVTFIYTRCPLPDYCPLMTSNFATIHRQMESIPELAHRVHLLSITVDPSHDTPAVLRTYGRERAGLLDFKDWEFLTGSEEEIRQAARFFGLDYFPESDQIIHNLRTALIAPDGRLVKIYRGNDWKPDDVISDLRGLLKESDAHTQHLHTQH
ncbi:uncharacterized protein SCO1/SenC/PrrC, involved in biogenesis of respiratory and photosynthetic systems [Pyrinomonas methylaliphatogenes]|uniref:Uncharacterized protein SCO1/SenC/PrrC, involved in biogenesis of respiratory and photosynthetic systems n=2 Tax=Pyrinomonas methylaliphatogenes TaxID=454194 RepID=A0A0B6WXW7_9BACT|nr:uncharacterized protein SCO1/SenC/PrrC, involved in biogenesis of respiratory and photosynthetic systems [Pyrinomonas methylaliphatogenes]